MSQAGLWVVNLNRDPVAAEGRRNPLILLTAVLLAAACLLCRAAVR